MKYLVIVIFLLSSKLLAQINPPDLRCLEVLPNGDIKLTWIAPTDPSNVFNSYEIFSSIAVGGPFTSIGGVGAIGITTFTHVGAIGNTQSRYYFVKTKFGAGGSGSTLGSDTIRSILLNITPGTPAINLQFNNIHQPKLSSSAATFTISKEYPAATWSNLGTTSNLNYADTISVCQASLNYQIALTDNSGCVSLSNIQGGIYNDTKAPDRPVIDSISVLPNGQTVLTWHVPRDLDITKYRIYEKIGVANVEIDSVIGRNSTIYTFTSTTATTRALSLFVAGIDSCKKIGSFDILPTTMYLTKTYNRCSYTTQLFWNEYLGLSGGVLEYRIYYSINGAAFQRIGSTTATSYTHTGVSPSQNITYYIRVVNSDQTITASSNRISFFSTQAQAPNFIYIRNVSIASESSATIKIYLDTSKPSKGVDIIRSEDGVNYSTITSLPPNGSAFYTYTDESIDASTTSYFYRAIVRDSCGNVRTKSPVAKTILLKITEDKELLFYKHLNWTDYKGFAGNVSGYNIFRVINDVVSSLPVATTGPSDTTYIDNVEDEAPNGCKIQYYVEAIEGLGNPYNFQENSFSNVVQVYVADKIFVPTAFAPHGVNRIWLPVTHFVDKSEYNLKVFNRWGQKLFETNDDREGWNGKDATADVYTYLISYKNSRGEYKELKGTFTYL